MKQELTSKKVFIRTLGCQMNVRDSEVISGLLRKAGYGMTDDPDKADIVIFNTCSVRQHAEDKAWSEIGRISKRYPLNAKRSAKPLIGLAGCMAQNYKDQIFQRAPAVDFVVGPSDIHKIPAIIRELSTIDHRPSTRNLFERKIWETESDARPEEIYHTGFHEDKNHAYVVISEGCSNFCSYCVVPYVRGPLHNRSHEEVLKEIREAVKKGITSITLLGQNVNAYQAPSLRSQASGPKTHGTCSLQPEAVNFIKLLEMVDGVKGLEEFSFITSHPRDTSVALFKAMAGLDKLKKCLHLPVQSGSDRILKLMNRGYTRKFYLDLAADFRTIVKGGELTTDIIVGFPSETEKEFQDTFDLVQEIGFNAAFIFKYSPRPHAEAGKLADMIEDKEKQRRHAAVLALQKEISKKLKSPKK